MSVERERQDNPIDLDDWSFINVETTQNILLIKDLSLSQFYFITLLGQSFEWIDTDETYNLKIEFHKVSDDTWYEIIDKPILEDFEIEINTVKYIQISSRIWFDIDKYDQIRVSVVLGGTTPKIEYLKCNLTED